MPDRLSMHAPLLVNTLGHCAGAIIFGILLYFLLLDWRRDPGGRSMLPGIAAVLALLWNAGSLVGLATLPGDAFSDAIVAASFSVLSLLPAVLLHISLGARWTPLSISGYVISSLAVILHIADLTTDAVRLHYAAILLVTIGFCALTLIALAQELSGGEPRHGSGKRLAGSMVLLLLAVSFVHFRADRDTGGWSGEIALHHAAIPLALFVLLQDYRFLLVDAFVRFLVDATLAAITVGAGLAMQSQLALLPGPGRQPFFTALAFVGACLLLSLFAFSRNKAQRLLTRVVFLRHATDRAFARLTESAAANLSDSGFLALAGEVMGDTFSASHAEIATRPNPALSALWHASPVLDSFRERCPVWARAVAPVRLSRGDLYFIYLGPRAGGRRYLSEDMALLDRLAASICEQIERMRNAEMLSLVAHAELRALQAQINPHFFFNALNTLYGTIPRASATARELVVNLADLFRVSFASEKVFVRIEEEIRIVRAYLAIEQLRLGPRLVSEIVVDDQALDAEVPVLSIQPLVENAVKHGVAAHTGSGFVRLRIRSTAEAVLVEITNSGKFGSSPRSSGGTGVGLDNVRRRLALYFGKEGGLTIESENDITTVSFSVIRKASHRLNVQTIG